MNNDIDFGHIAKVALTGAITAVIADYLHTNYSDEMAGLLAQLQSFINGILDSTEQPPAA
jgi:hypothetical protein